MELRNKIIEILSKGQLMSLATSDEGGLWVSDVIFVYDDDLNIYWMSDPDVRHSQAILKNNNAAGSITVNCYGEKPEIGVQFSGTVEKIDGARYDLAKKHFAKRGKPEPKEEDDVLQGDSWYVLKPKKIDVIDTGTFGWEKPKLEL